MHVSIVPPCQLCTLVLFSCSHRFLPLSSTDENFASHYKMFRVTGLLILTSFTFATGFALRAKGSWDYSNLNIYIGSTILVYMAP